MREVFDVIGQLREDSAAGLTATPAACAER